MNSPAFARLLAARGWKESDATLAAFLDPQLEHLHSPWQMLGMEAAVERIVRAARGGETIRIFGDYDADGTLATVIVRQALRTLGVEASYHLPRRLGEGYGLQIAAMEQAVRDGVGLAITVDNGIRDLAPLERARELGLDVIVTDHHLPGERLPEAVAIVNPHQPGCAYPDKRLCGSGIAFKLAQALLERAGKLAPGWPPGLRSYLKLVALATIADAVPLLGENRVLVHYGLQELRQPVNAGLRALLQQARPQAQQPISSRDVAFQVAPRINAAGRMGAAERVVELFFSPAEQAEAIANELSACNAQRQQECSKIEAAIAASPMPDDPVLVLAGEGWHRGVVGIVAGRMLDQTGKPVLVLALEPRADGGLQAHGSGRAPEGVHLLTMLESCRPLLDRFGGHARAVGLSLAAENIAPLRAALAGLAGTVSGVAEDDTFAVTLDELTPEFAAEIGRLQPFGEANPEPRFRLRGVQLSATPRVLQERHLKMEIEQAGARGTALLWNYERHGGMPAAGSDLELTGRLQTNHHPRFGGGVELIVQTIHVTFNVTGAPLAASHTAGKDFS